MSLESHLYQVFGHHSFRHQQKDIIEALVINKVDVCAVMATGHGKSLCYQLPAIITKQPSIIISPLLSLMEDQKHNLESKGVSVCCYNSELTNKSETQQKILNGDYQIIYLTPEAIVLPSTHQWLKTLESKFGLSVIAIDEAHCVSLWGQSFRKSYLQLGCLKDWFPNVPMLALTGTATPEVQKDIIKFLKLDHPLEIRTGSDRPNLSYYVHLKTNLLNDLLPFVNHQQSTIIYCPTRDSTEKVSELLFKNGVKCEAYHAGLYPQTKAQIHHYFLTGEITCIVATIAFGMGIDKSDIRQIIHYGCPKDIESYTQEVGRGGRDGQPSQCHVFFSQTDFAGNRYFLKDIHEPHLRSYKEKMIQAVEKYLYSQTCRRQFILEYFGETITHQNALCCDNCLHPPSTEMIDVGIEVQQVLSLIQDFSGKFGRLMYLNALRGANLAKMPPIFKNHKLYGCGQKHSLEWWKVLTQQIVNDNLISETSNANSYGSLIALNSHGRNWLDLHHTHPTFMITKSSQNAILFDLPKPKLISPKTTPTSTLPPTSTPTSTLTLVKSKLSLTQMISYQLFTDNQQSIAEIAKTRQLGTSTIEGHLVDALKLQMPFDYTKLTLSKTKYNEIVTIIMTSPLNGDVSKLAPIKALCSGNTTYFQIKCTLAILESGQAHLLI